MRTQTTAETLRTVLEAALQDVHTGIPGTIKSYDSATQTATIEIGVQRVRLAEDEDQDLDAPESLPILQGVPIVWPRAGGFFLHWPMTAGDEVWILFSESDINAWRASGGVVDPGVATRHGLSGAVALPGMFTIGGANASANGSNGRIGREGGPFVEFTATEIQAGGTSPLGIAATVEAHFAKVATALDAIAARIKLLDSGIETDLIYGVLARGAAQGTDPIPSTVLKGT